MPIKLLQWIKNTVRRLKTRSFLIRLVASTLLAAMIPLMLLAARQLRSESDLVHRSAQNQLEGVASAVAGRFEDLVQKINTVHIKLMLSGYLKESVLLDSVQAQVDAIERIGYYADAIPFAKCYGLYLCATGEAYTNTGKMKMNGLARFGLGIPQARFEQLLAAYSEVRGFVPWDECDGNLIYLVPIFIGSARAASNYTFFVLSPTLLLDSLSAELSGHYGISSITDGNGVAIYRGGAISQDALDADDDYLTCARSSGGYQVTVYVDKTELRRNVEAITENAQLITVIISFLCMALIAMVALMNYWPLARVVRHVRGETPNEGGPELNFILTSYARLSDEKSQLRLQLYEKNMMIADRAVENLLSGRAVPPGDLRLLRLDMPYYRVVCARLSHVREVSPIIERNEIGSPIFAIEMYADERLAFVCGFSDDSAAALRPVIAGLRRLLASGTQALGISAAFDTPERLFIAYLQASKALYTESSQPDRIAADAAGTQVFLLDESREKVEKLAYAIKCGDGYMTEFADGAFEKILSQTASRSAQRYACYQVIDLYRRLGENSGLDLNMEQISQLLQESSIQDLCARFLEILHAARAERQREVSGPNSLFYANVLAFITERFTDPAFSMNDVADRLGISVYAASRMLKTMTGINFRQYVNDMRVEHARDLLLTTDLPINDISLRAGFSSPSYFISIFKKTVGETPGNFRKQTGI